MCDVMIERKNIRNITTKMEDSCDYEGNLNHLKHLKDKISIGDIFLNGKLILTTLYLSFLYGI